MQLIGLNLYLFIKDCQCFHWSTLLYFVKVWCLQQTLKFGQRHVYHRITSPFLINTHTLVCYTFKTLADNLVFFIFGKNNPLTVFLKSELKCALIWSQNPFPLSFGSWVQAQRTCQCFCRDLMCGFNAQEKNTKINKIHLSFKWKIFPWTNLSILLLFGTITLYFHQINKH